ncbi:MAG: hypothetical protein HFG10_09930 [Oscillibacter sp.]|jgi:hypothetical protein|nr:hypothetical protein [Oscillibacter sp.]
MKSDPAARDAERRAFSKPRTGYSVWPGQSCPAFTRRVVRLGESGGCWFCRYANFHLRESVALEVGVCCWPREQAE